jgi:DNA modification methylase
MKTDKIYHNDCLDQINKFPDNCIDLIVTSPPYAGKRGMINNHSNMIPIKKYVEWFSPISLELLRILKPTGSFVLNIKEPATGGERSTYIIELILIMKEQGWYWTEEYVWHKTTSFPGKWSNRFRDGWERCLHFTKEKKFKMNQDAVKVPIGEWSKTRLMKNNGTEKRKITEMSKDDRKRRRSKSGSGLERQVANWLDRDEVFPDNVLQFAPIVNNKKKHSAAFPDELPEWFIKLFTDPGDLVLDPFIGSGTTAVTAIKLKRHYIGIEKQKKYWNLAKKNTKLAKAVPEIKKQIRNAAKKDLDKRIRNIKSVEKHQTLDHFYGSDSK